MTFEKYMQKDWPCVWPRVQSGDVGIGLAMLKSVYEAGQRHANCGHTGPSGLINPLDMKFVSKIWGWELWICNNDRYCGKKLFVKQGHWLSFHEHHIKDEVLFVESGSVWFNYEQKDMTYHDPQSALVNSVKLAEGQAYHVRPNTKHQIQAITDAVIFEFSTKHDDADSIRTTTDLVIDHGDNGHPIKTWVNPNWKPPPPRHLPPGVNFDSTPSWEKDEMGL